MPEPLPALDSPVRPHRETVAAALPALLAGRVSREALDRDSAWRVLATFRRSLYLQAARGALVCVGPASLGAGPLNLLAALPEAFSWEAAGLQPGHAAGCDGQILRIGGGVAIAISGVRVWRPPAIPAAWTPVVLAANLEALRFALPHRGPRGGLAPLIPAAASGGAASSAAPAEAAPLLRAAWPAIAALRAWAQAVALEGSAEPPPDEIGTLLGLGPGLTPSGDDLTGGALIALRGLGWTPAADRLAAWVLERAPRRTHPISRAHLVCAAAGEGALAVHEALRALCTPGAIGLAPALDALDTVGHSSGWDALAGVCGILGAAAAADRLPGGSIARVDPPDRHLWEPPCQSRPIS
jgi:hypothetical protein